MNCSVMVVDIMKKLQLKLGWTASLTSSSTKSTKASCLREFDFYLNKQVQEKVALLERIVLLGIKYDEIYLIDKHGYIYM